MFGFVLFFKNGLKINVLVHLASIFSEEKKKTCEMLTVNISPNVGSSTKHRHTWLYLVELDLKGELALQILDRKCADIKYLQYTRFYTG